MSWQLTVILQITVGSLLVIATRVFSLRSKQTFFFSGVILYLMIFLVGAAIAIIANQSVPHPPTNPVVWLFLIGEGVFIPIGWLIQYRLIRSIGANSSVVIGILNACAAALLGIIALGDAISPSFLLGAIFIIGSSFVALRVGVSDSNDLPIRRKIGLVAVGMIVFSIGIFCEKQAISLIGVFDYAMYGWLMQLIGAVIIFIIAGKREIVHISKRAVGRGAVLGLLTSVSGGLFIYALSQGTLSQTIIVTSSKLALTMALSAILLGERSHMWLRVIALTLASIGVWLIA